jgi:hypothetical protein
MLPESEYMIALNDVLEMSPRRILDYFLQFL